MEDKKPEYPVTPETDKIILHKEHAQVIGEFLEWLGVECKVGLFQVKEFDCEGDIPTFSQVPFCENTDILLAKFFDIDLKKVEEERAAILEYIRVKHADKPAPAFSMKVEGEELGDLNGID